MTLHRILGSARGPKPLAFAVASILSAAALPAQAQESGGGLEEIVVTAQRRETDLQTTPIAISAYSGETLTEAKIFSAADLANSVPALSLTALTPLDAELNIRGITNTRLDSPTSDPSVGTFVDGVYIGRTGDYNLDFYDIERIEVIRGPQGVLLGKNVVGGALSIITAAPEFDTSGRFLLGYGNYGAVTTSGHVTGGLTDNLAGRLSFQLRQHEGYAEDVLHGRKVEDLDSTQARAQLLWRPGDSGWSVRGIFDYNKDSTNGINTVAVAGGTKICEESYLQGNCTRPWSNLRAYLGLKDPRKNIAQSLQLVGDKRRNQYLDREGWGLTLDIEKAFEHFTFNSLTGYRTVESNQFYDQTGAGPEALNWSVPEWLGYIAWVNAKYGDRPATSNNGQFLFAQPVVEWVEGDQISQEFRFTSNNPDSRFDWIAGIFGKQDNVDKTDHFKGENFLGALVPGGNNPLSTLSGENRWINEGETTNLAAFAQVGFKFTDSLKLSVGLRYTQDEKEGVVDALVVETGDRFSPNDPRANVTIEALCRAPDGTIIRNPPPPAGNGGTGVAVCDPPNRWIYSAGEGFRTNYSEKWTETTPQATLDWKVNDNWFLYATYAEGFKGGGFDDTPANVAQAITPFDPEKAKNYEIGFKSTLWDRRMRLNAAFFMMDYTDLQVTQTNAACLCNITDNAASADIKGVEAEFQLAPTDTFRYFLSGSYVDAKYEDFIESAINPSTGQPLDSSGNQLQRTPDTQISTGIDWKLPLGTWGNALDFRVSYTWQSEMFWATDNVAKEDAYGLVDARIALSPDGAPWEVALWGKNLSDELYRVNVISFFGEEVSQFGPPRTYGVDVTFRF
jgi:iron complex outermembrane receptor protein